MPLTTPEELRALYGAPMELSRKKVLPQLDAHCRAFIGISPFLVLSTSDGEGRVDASPRGDGPGFVKVLDARRLLVPDRRGNNRVDSLGNVMANPHVGLLFFVPGMNETLRVNGRAEIVTDPDTLAPLAEQGKIPKSALLVTVEEAFLHCAKALIRSRLWEPERHIERSSFPPFGHMLSDQIGGLDAEETERFVQQGIRDRMY